MLTPIMRPILQPVLVPVDYDYGDAFNPLSLFAGGVQGFWYDPSDFSTLFQDATGTTPVTEVGQPVGLMLDKSKGLVLGSELAVNGGFDTDTDWTKGSGWAISGGKAVRSVSETTSTIKQSATLIAGAFYRIEFDYYNVTSSALYVALRGGSTVFSPAISLTNATGRYSCVLRAVSGNTSFDISASGLTAGSFDNFTIRELTGNHAYQTTALSRPTLQQDSTGRYYLSFDGTDDGMVTNSINFTGTDKMTLWAGIRKLSDAATAILCELGTNLTVNTGAFYLGAPGSVASNYVLASKGTVQASVIASPFVAPITNVVACQASIATPTTVAIKVNGGVASTSATTQGTGNYGNYPLYIGRRDGTSLPFNGRIYQLIGRGAETPLAQIVAMEQYVNVKTGAY